MPYLPYDPNSEDEEQRRLKQASMGAGMAPTGADAPGPGPSASQEPAAGPTNFVNFDRYFNANKTTAERAAKNLGDRVEYGAQDVRGAADMALGAFRQDADRSRPDAPVTPGEIRPDEPEAAETGLPGAARTPAAQQGLEGGAPQKTHVTEAQAEQYAGATYQGPKSLMDSQNFLNVQNLGEQSQQQLDSLGDASGIAALMGGQRTGGGDLTGASMLSSALVGHAGRSRFDDLRSKYAGIDKYLSGAVDQSTQYADGVESQIDTAADAWGGRLEKHKADRAAAEARAEAETRKPPKRGYDEYSGVRAEDVVKHVGTVLSPLDLVWNLASNGGESPINSRTREYDNQEAGGLPWAGIGNAVTGGLESLGYDTDATRADVFKYMNLAGQGEAAKAVYESMTEEELAALERMAPRAQIEWVNKRKAELGIK